MKKKDFLELAEEIYDLSQEKGIPEKNLKFSLEKIKEELLNINADKLLIEDIEKITSQSVLLPKLEDLKSYMQNNNWKKHKIEIEDLNIKVEDYTHPDYKCDDGTNLTIRLPVNNQSADTKRIIKENINILMVVEDKNAKEILNDIRRCN